LFSSGTTAGVNKKRPSFFQAYHFEIEIFLKRAARETYQNAKMCKVQRPGSLTGALLLWPCAFCPLSFILQWFFGSCDKPARHSLSRNTVLFMIDRHA
jgi:hypothetical protein